MRKKSPQAFRMEAELGGGQEGAQHEVWCALQGIPPQLKK